MKSALQKLAAIGMVVAVVACSLVIIGCTKREKNTATGAAIGGGGGALIGGLAGGPVGAGIGAGVGLGAGALIGNRSGR